MAPQGGPRGGGGRGGGTKDESVKDLFHRIGGIIQQQVHNAAKQYSSELKGDLLRVEFSKGGSVTTDDPCELDYTKDTNVTSGHGREHPCFGRQPVRFSDTKGAECYWSRIKGSKDNTIGACAPFRKLHMCDRNLEEIYPEKIATAHNLLVDVLLAAKHEGEMITKNLKEYDEKHYNSRICTELARSFADIGDIIRGKDLFLGHKQRKKHLEKRLEQMFKNIMQNNKKQLGELSTAQVREYWWALNRDQVWKAITCRAGEKDTYSINTGNGETILWDQKCGHGDYNLLTNLDYVPQYLRWFQEWAEDFCRKRKKKLTDAIKNCRGEDGKEKYCSSNGYDCEQTIRAIEQLRMGNGCTKCLLSCNPFRKWMDNQKVEFKKQKEKYTKEINERNENTKKDTKDGPINKIYAKQFYDELNKQYGSVDDFLELLNKEKECKSQPYVKGKGNLIDFKNKDDTFGPTEYCVPCPPCGVIKNGKTFKERSTNDDACKKKNEVYKVPEGAKINEINVLFSGEEHDDITNKLSEFCKNPNNENGTKNEKWECYYQSSKNNKCKVLNDKSVKDHDKIMTFHDFFYFWVGHLLNDAINWRTELTKCLSDIKLKKCKNMCKHNCKCFKKWIDKKEKEWEQVKNQFYDQGDINNGVHYTILESVLEFDFFPIIKKAYGELQSIEHMRQMIEENQKNPNRTKDDEDAIDVLLDHEKEEAESCLQTHEEQEKCRDDQDSEDEEEEKPPERQNPCATPSGSTHPAIVNQIAHQMHEDAHTEASKRGLAKLKADASKGEYNHTGKGNDLKGDKICNISIKHSNATGESNEPCHGKDNDHQRFNVGTPWKGGNFVNPKYPEAYMPPRREHICTSNLEHIDINKITPISNVNDSFLGDVLLAAKMEGKDIVEKLGIDKSGICNAMKYSFADLGDIIRGKDLWDHKDQTKIKDNLKKIFEKIKSNLPGIQDKYTGDEKNNPPYKLLREDWWEANRRKVWKAMKCTYTDKIQCNNHAPYDDYIPQRLRWMTEWAEWYCKYQSQEYEKLKEQCKECMSKGDGKCTQGDNYCTPCAEACKEYKTKIDTWKQQWQEMEIKYLLLYRYAQIAAPFGGISAYGNAVQDKDKAVVQFLQELQKVTGDTNDKSASQRSKRSIDAITTDPTTPYSSAEGYIHQELPNVGCKEQTKFCTGGDNYAFKDPPNGYDDACKCDTRKAQPPKKEEKKDACEIVHEILNGNNGRTTVGECNPKGSYPDWNCESGSMNNENEGACMPPRRIKLCIHDLKALKSDASEEELRKAFIKCAAIETFWLWHKYKTDNNDGTEAQQKLESGTIPEDFKRQMFYTYGDYRDFLFGTDISKLNTHTEAVKTNIDRIFPNSNAPNDQERKKFWDDNGKDIWKGMICGLSHAGGVDKVKFTDNRAYNYETVTFSGDKTTTLEEFAQTPQFLRWFTEWGEHFCRERKEKVKELSEGCKDCNVSDSDGSCERDGEGCTKCREECKKYKEWLKKWRENYDKQKDKFKGDKNSGTYSNDPVSNKSEDARDYLDKTLEKICSDKNGDCEYKCMKNVSKQESHDGSITDNMPQSLDNEPQEVKGKCDCKEAEVLPEIPILPAKTQQENACEIVKKLLQNEESTEYKEACKLKYDGKKEKHTRWNCTNKTKDGEKDGEVCIPPRRQKLYLGSLEKLNSGKSQDELRTAFIKCAAIETVFAWHKYKVDKIREDIEKNVEIYGIQYKSSVQKDLKNDLESGTIPEDFKRQMFYTFGDYRDLCLGKDMYKNMSEVNEKIKGVFPNTAKPDDEREKFWDLNAEAIWEGMLCALSYDTETKIIIPDVRTILTAPQSKYQYNTATISSIPSSSGGPIDDTKLTDFVKRPTFFRWLEEWKEEFCRKRKHKLKKVKEECRGKSDNKYSSGDGEDCENILKQNFNIVSDLEYPSCALSCKSYKEWINKKKDEFKKQEIIYDKEIKDDKSTSDSTYDKEFYKNLQEKYPTATDFVASLKDGSHCNNNNVEDIIDFKKLDETFGPSDYCKACPVFGVKRIKGVWNNNDEKQCEGKKATTKDINNMKDGTEQIDILVSDNSTNGFPDNLNNLCDNTNIFKAIRKDQWSCKYSCGLDVCDLINNNNNNTHIDKRISIRILFKRWLEYFLNDYIKLKKKLNSCTNNGEESICIKECKNRCVCAEKWIEKKKGEWEIVRKRFFNQYKVGDSQIYFNVRRFLEIFLTQIDVAKTKGDFESLDALEKSSGCTDPTNSENGVRKYNDVVDCFLDKLKEKIDTCKIQHDTTDKPEPQCDIPLPDDDDQPEEDPDTSTTSLPPEFCPEIPSPEAPQEPEPEPELEPKADADPVPGPKEAEDPPAKVPEVPKKPVPEKKVTPKRRPREVTHSIVTNLLLPSAFPLTVGVAFAAFSYFLLKKKSKSTIDLLSVIDIPKGEYGIPTLKSKNRYIPYASDRYKGKTYIYMEGDESDDYTYIGDISSSDITSSESEYEDIDINNIYPYKSPKYKTLIDVVLEPSKRDTFDTQSDTSTNKFTDNEWNQLKQDFISNILQSTQMDLPNENIIDDFMDKGIQPNNLILDVNMPEKPFITSIHDRDLHNGEEVTYNINFDVSKNINEITNTTDDSKYVSNNIYSGIDLINDSLNSDQHVDIYDELLKRKENEIFGTNHTKHTTTNSIAKQTHTDPILIQLDLFHKWLDRHRNMCEQWNKNKKEELLDKLKEEWNKKNNNNSDLTHTSSNIPSGENSIKNVLNTDVSIQIDMDDPKPINEFTNMDNIIDNLEKNSGPYYDIDEDDIIYFDIDDEKTPMYHNNMDNNKSNVPTKVQIEMNVINKQELFQEEFPISDIWNI